MTKHILAYMDFDCPTGFGVVATNVLERLTPFFEQNNIHVDVVALNNADTPDRQYNKCISIYNIKKFAPNDNDKFYRESVLHYLNWGDYDLFWGMNDVAVLFSMANYIKTIQKRKKKDKEKVFKTMVYTPIDSFPHPNKLKNIHIFDSVITYTRYAKKSIEDAIELLKHKNEIKKNVSPNISIIPHGMDTEKFYYIANQKNVLRDQYDLPRDCLLFGNINKNQPRKDIATSILAFRLFKQQYGELRKSNENLPVHCALYLHSYPKDPSGVDVGELCDNIGLDIGYDVYYPTNSRYLNGEYREEDLNNIYNCLDVFVNTTMAEGWGLTITEAMCVGLPIVAPLHTSIKEITNNGSLIYPIKGEHLIEHVQIHDGNYVRFKSNPHEVAKQMAYACTDSRDNEERILSYKDKMNQYTWESVSKDFKQKIKHLIL